MPKKRGVFMKYYHVSSYLQPGDRLTKNTKNNYDYCCYVSVCDVSTFEKYLECYKSLCLSGVHQKTGRTAAKWACEAIFEHIRKSEYPNKPSRIWGVYLCDKLDDARGFLNSYRKPRKQNDGTFVYAHIFEIELEASQVQAFDMEKYSMADNKLQNTPDNIEAFDYAVCMAREYWSGMNTDCCNVEHITDDVVVIGNLVE